jgi:hypothetical protein
MVNVTVLAPRGDVTETLRAARAGKLATRIRVRHRSLMVTNSKALEGFDEGFDRAWPNGSRKAGAFSVCHFSHRHSRKLPAPQNSLLLSGWQQAVTRQRIIRRETAVGDVRGAGHT